ncbi:xanthine dehydrogenase/oxidase-like isoform X2 [Halichondria panicea]|uniref:xanthine dehydrogenase/oxidase-like isoform X2 n=1 Tax=Halichondria panicea TaxID=6063 RepID=UPI00312B37F1
MAELEGAKESISFYVNGGKVVVESPDSETTLLYFLRTQLRLTDTKLGCGEGGCGACTVMLSWYQEGVVTHTAVNACLAPLCSVDGMAVTTLEGIGSSRDLLHPVQERIAIARAHGSQCGFCTPGFVMSMYTLLRNSHAPSEKQIEGAFEGNLCRCTGYRPILEGFKTFSQTGCCGGATKCCMDVKSSDGIKTIKGPSILFDASKFRPLDPTQEPTFPPALRTEPLIPLAIKGPRVSWYRPLTLDQLLVLRARFPQSKLVIGNTEIGVEVKFKGAFYDTLISCSQVPELNKMAVTDEGLTVGASVTLTRLEEQLKHLVESLPENKTRTFSALLEMLRWFAGQQIRNVSTVTGVIVMDPSFFTGYKKTSIKPGEILLSILIPFTKEHYDAIKRYITNGPMLVEVSMNSPHRMTRSFMDSLLAFWPGLQVLWGDVDTAIHIHDMLYHVMERHNFLPEAFTHDFRSTGETTLSGLSSLRALTSSTRRLEIHTTWTWVDQW